MTLTFARGLKLLKPSRRWNNKSNMREGRNNFCGHDKDELDSHLDLPSGL